MVRVTIVVSHVTGTIVVGEVVVFVLRCMSFSCEIFFLVKSLTAQETVNYSFPPRISTIPVRSTSVAARQVRNALTTHCLQVD